MFNKQHIRFKGTKEVNQAIRNTSENTLSRRFWIVIGFVIAIFSIYALRLFVIQISNNDYYTTKLEQYSTNTFTVDALRGEISDRNYEKLVYNENVICATYYSVRDIKEEEIKAMVNFLIKNCNVDISSVTTRELKDYLIMKDKNYVESLITNEEKKQLRGQDDFNTKFYNLEIERITDKILKEKMSEDDIKYYKLFYAIKSCTSGSAVLLEGISVKEASLIGENTELLRGVKVTSDWKRAYTHKTALKSILGKVTTKKQGLPATLKDQLLALNYSNDSRVGTSGIEKQYEDVLSGSKSAYQLQYSSNGNPIVKKKSNGNNGRNIQLTIDYEIQKKLSDYLHNELKSHSGEPYNKHIYCVLIEPATGDIIAMAGKRRMNNGEIVDWESGNYLEAYEIGSTMKAATLYTCFKNNIIKANHYEADTAEGIQIAGTPAKHSWNLRGLGNLNEVTAMAYSSNIYMMKIIIKLGGGVYRKNQPLRINNNAFTKLRNAAGELGLGVKTGLDVPAETLGYRGTSKLPGNLLDFSIGQYDTYSPMQLATYAATLANGGVKVKPHLYKSSYVTNDEGERVTLHQFKKTVVDDVSQYKTAFTQIQKGMRAVVEFGTPSGGFAGYPYKVAGKTGTAQVGSNQTAFNHIFIGYGPYNGKSGPQVACIVMVEMQINNNSAPRTFRYAMDLYFKKYGYTG